MTWAGSSEQGAGLNLGLSGRGVTWAGNPGKGRGLSREFLTRGGAESGTDLPGRGGAAAVAPKCKHGAGESAEPGALRLQAARFAAPEVSWTRQRARGQGQGAANAPLQQQDAR